MLRVDDSCRETVSDVDVTALTCFFSGSRATAKNCSSGIHQSRLKRSFSADAELSHDAASPSACMAAESTLMSSCAMNQ